MFERMEADSIAIEQGKVPESSDEMETLAVFGPNRLDAFKRGMFLAMINIWTYLYAFIAIISVMTLVGSMNIVGILAMWVVLAIAHSAVDILICGCGLSYLVSHVSTKEYEENVVNMNNESESNQSSTYFIITKIMFIIMTAILGYIIFQVCMNVVETTRLIGFNIFVVQKYCPWLNAFIKHTIGTTFTQTQVAYS